MSRGPEKLPSHAVVVSSLPTAGLAFTLVADERERVAIADFCEVETVDMLEADLEVSRWRGDGVRVRGRLRASLQQRCVVTLEPVAQAIDEPVERKLLWPDSRLTLPPHDEGGELVVDAEGDDPPEMIDGEKIDLWAIILETLVLAIDPWPRAPGAELAATGDDADGAAARPSPFAALERLKQTKKDD